MALKLKGSTSGFVAIDAPSVAGNNTLTLPENNGSAHQILANDITAGVTTFTQITVSRNGDLTVPGTISIGGTLTYEDVTSVDSVGIVTARSGVRINGGGLTIIGDTTGLKATGISTFVDVSARNLTVSAASTFTGNIKQTAPGSSTAKLTLNNESDTTGMDVGYSESSGLGFINVGQSGSGLSIKTGGTASGNERLRITSAGKVLIGTSTPQGNANADDLVVSTSGHSGITIRSGTSSNGNIFFADGTSGGDEYRGVIDYNHSSNHMSFSTNAAERLRIDSSGRLLIGTATASSAGNSQYSKLEVSGNTTGATGPGHLSIKRGTAVGSLSSGDTLGRLIFSGLEGGDFAYIQVSADAAPASSDYPGRMMFFTTADGASSATERLRITSGGNVNIGNALSNTTRLFAVENTLANGGEIAYIGNNDGGSNYGGLIISAGETDRECRLESAWGSSFMTFYTNSGSSTEKLRITSGGKIGLNYAGTPPSEDVMICTSGQASPAGLTLSHLSGGNRYGLRFQTISGTNAGITFSPFINSTYSEGMRIQYSSALNSTKVGIGNVDPAYPLTVQYAGNNDSNAAVSRFYQLTNNQGEDHTCFIVRHAAAISGQNGVGLLFQNGGGTTVGKIDFGQSTTQYRTSSDYRLKENDVKITDGITRIKQLRPIRFNFIVEPDKTVDGFFAHEVTAVPEAISGTKDEVDSDNNPVYQGIDHSKLVPLLTAALQEAVAKIETLEAKVASLEGS